MEQDPQSLFSLAHNISHIFSRKTSTCLSTFACTDILPFAIPCGQQLAHHIVSPEAIIYGKEPFPDNQSSCRKYALKNDANLLAHIDIVSICELFFDDIEGLLLEYWDSSSKR